jgi:hypothetical protein
MKQPLSTACPDAAHRAYDPGMFKSIGVLALGFVLVGCGDDTGSGGGDTGGGGQAAAGGGEGGGTGGAQPVDCTFVGSCANTEGSSCVDYGGVIEEAETEAACTDGGGVWSAVDPCDTTDAAGGCDYPTFAGGPCSLVWYYEPFFTAEQVMTECEGEGTFVTP